jgi:integrase
MRKKHLDAEELETLFQYLKGSETYHSLLIGFLILTGFRVHELFDLKISDLDFRKGTVTLWDAAKNSNGRVAGLPEWFVNKVMRRKRPEGCTSLVELLGYRSKGGDIETFKAVMRRSWGKVKRDVFGDSIRLGLHSLRHTFAMELYKVVKDPIIVCRALGHKSLSSTLTYLEYVDQPAQILATKKLFERKRL